jgi:hypothetical protein
MSGVHRPSELRAAWGCLLVTSACEFGISPELISHEVDRDAAIHEADAATHPVDPTPRDDAGASPDDDAGPSKPDDPGPSQPPDDAGANQRDAGPDIGPPPGMPDASRPDTCETSQVPVMQAAESDAGKVERSGAYSPEYEAVNAFDQASSMWISEVGQTPAWISYEWKDGPRFITRYALSFTNGVLTSRAPRDFTLEGWDGGQWVIVDRRTNETAWGMVERREYAVAAPGPHAKYRLSFTDDNDRREGVEVISLSEIELFGCSDLP